MNLVVLKIEKIYFDELIFYFWNVNLIKKKYVNKNVRIRGK